MPFVTPQRRRRVGLGQVERGRSLEQNIILKSGDTVVVP
jgi:hypothetical protein